MLSWIVGVIFPFEQFEDNNIRQNMFPYNRIAWNVYLCAVRNIYYNEPE